MQKVLHSDTIRAALAAKGWDQKTLAEAVGVSAQSVTNWLKGSDFPRPAALLKLATTLSIGFDQLVQVDTASQPVVAFRKKGNAKTTQDHVQRAMALGALLKPLTSYLPARQSLRTQIADTSLTYDRLQATVAAVRAKLGIGQEAALSYERLIGQFAENDAVIVPVMWGAKKNHENALHILLPAEKVTFIYLNLDTHLEDFKFWMAHELAHVYTPQLAGKPEGEDFADAFAGALLFPQELAHQVYVKAVPAPTVRAELAVLHAAAQAHQISLYSVFMQVSLHAQAARLPALKVTAQEVHAIRNSPAVRGELVSAPLFAPLPPAPATYIASAHSVFQSAFFPALRAMLRERGTGSGYVQQALGLAMPDSQAIYEELTR
jgi:transcriptional regulator with XRE-family HTH domain/Zn-dependent peptidase ImmA (M78 family)